MDFEYQVSAYPKDFASFVRSHWQAEGDYGHDSFPRFTELEHVISTCYQASLLRDEGRPVRFRLIFLASDLFSPNQGPPTGLHRLLFIDPLPFTVRELRKLSPSIDFYGSLIGLGHDERRELSIWGIIHSGSRWRQNLDGGIKEFQPLPNSLVINVTNPGRITVCNGSIEIATLNCGKIVSPSLVVLDSMWIRSEIGTIIVEEELALHREARKRAKKPWAIVGPEFFGTLRKITFMRIISKIRSYRHGGTLILIPNELKEEFVSENPYVKLRYKFVDEEPSRRLQTLILKAANELAESYGSIETPEREVGWTEYLTIKKQSVSSLDEAVLEWVDLIANLTQVDGALLITQKLELIGFGAEISGKLERVSSVAQALDPEGLQVQKEQTDCVGTRHRSAYSLCNALHKIVAVVVSQDGTAQLVKWNDGIVKVWEQLSSSLLEV